MSNLLLIDTDVICYQFAYRNEERYDFDGDGELTYTLQPDRALAEVREFLTDLQERLDGERIYLILSDRDANFRKELDPTYKSNRTKPKPPLWETIRTYIEGGEHGYPVKFYNRLEGDDVLGMLATHPRGGPKSVMVSIDKDMQTVPGRLFLWNKPELGVRTISKEEATRFHMLQVLMGDPVDGYKGIPGVGIKKAERILEDVAVEDLWEAVAEAYCDHELTEEDALLQARLAYILQHGDYKKGKVRLWNPDRITT